MGYATRNNYAQTNAAGVTTNGVATNATWTGPWIRVDAATSLAFQIILTATGAPVAALTLEGTNDPAAMTTPDAVLDPGITVIANAALTALNLAANVNTLIEATPSPRICFIRMKYTYTSGGNAGLLLKVAYTMFGGAP